MGKPELAPAKEPRGRYSLLDGRVVDLRGMTPRERAFVVDLQKMVQAGVSYFEIERVALGPGSAALRGRNRVDKLLASTPLYLVAEDIAARAGIEQGLILAPEHERRRAAVPSDGSMMSVVQAAALIGISRTAVYKAIAKATLKATRVGNVTVVDRASAYAYRDRREADHAGLSREAGLQSGLAEAERRAHT